MTKDCHGFGFFSNLLAACFWFGFLLYPGDIGITISAIGLSLSCIFVGYFLEKLL